MGRQAAETGGGAWSGSLQGRKDMGMRWLAVPLAEVGGAMMSEAGAETPPVAGAVAGAGAMALVAQARFGK